MARNHSGSPVRFGRVEARLDRGTERGVSRAGCLTGIVIVFLLAYTAVQFIGAEIDYRAIASQVQRSARVAHETPDEGLAAQIKVKANELGLPPAAGRATIRRLSGNRISIAVQYPDSVTFFGRWHWVRDRRIQIEYNY